MPGFYRNREEGGGTEVGPIPRQLSTAAGHYFRTHDHLALLCKLITSWIKPLNPLASIGGVLPHSAGEVRAKDVATHC